MQLEKLECIIRQRNTHNSWGRAVKVYAIELVQCLKKQGCVSTDGKYLMLKLLNGALSWRAYSYGGRSLIYDEDIAYRLLDGKVQYCKDGTLMRPNPFEDWFDVQARALESAAEWICEIVYAFEFGRVDNER